ncbi:MAG: hypothetical protein GY943_15565 [Chloroflexi bacterium]|nr:hypothetical protein [Chloroflexota bacterium]
MQNYWPMFKLYQAMRSQLMEILTDDALAYTVGGDNPPIGTLCKEIGEVEHAYIESFRTLQMDFSYKNSIPGLDNSVAQLTTWYEELDTTLQTTIESFTEADLQNKIVVRGADFKLPIRIQLDVYKEALLIFYGKMSVYLKAMGKDRPEQWTHWLG